MALTSLSYAAPVRRLIPPAALDYDRLEAAAALADAGDTTAAIIAVFSHLFPALDSSALATTPLEFVQGSSRVTARIDGAELAITVPLVRLSTAGNPVAALRYVLTTIAGSGQLYQPRLRGDELHLEFRDKLSRMHPSKVLEVLRRMPVDADRYDDWLIGQFGALPLDRAAIEAITDDEAARADAIWRSHWDEIDELLKEAQRKRSVWFLNEVSAIAVFRIKFALPVCGDLAARLSESASTWNDGQEETSKRETALARCVKEMKALSAAELAANLGHATYAISPLSEGKPEILSGYFAAGEYITTIDKYRTSGKSFEAALALTSSCTFLLARYAWEPAIAAALTECLAGSAGKPFRDAASYLWDHCKGLVDEFCGDEDGDEEPDANDTDASDEPADAASAGTGPDQEGDR
jgi:hypothetical protein